MARRNELQKGWRVELELDPSRVDPLGKDALHRLALRGLSIPHAVRSRRGFLLPGNLSAPEVQRVAHDLLADAVVEQAHVLAPGEVSENGERMVVIRRLPGVADPEAQSAARALGLLGIANTAGMESYRAYRVLGPLEDPAKFRSTAERALANPVLERVTLADQPVHLHPVPSNEPAPRTEIPLLHLQDEGLAELSQSMALSLTVPEMRAIQAHFKAAGREPVDVELETLAQTWSEHCKHKTLTGPVELCDGERVLRRYGNLLKETVFEATQRLSPDWCWSVFRDNAGVIALTEDLGIAIKVETHNHPSALDPYGGAGTGIGGVIRDILGTGLGARPFAATDVFCVGPHDYPRESLPPGTLHPDRVLAGVVAGVRDYGNRMGIPTVAGTVIRHPGYVANPLVFAGCVGSIPKNAVNKEVLPGDRILALGGRTGRDGIHGATFSSAALHEESETVDAAAVQIGDPITEKKVLDLLLIARDEGLFRALTDCGAGGFSSAVGEMGEECGADVVLDDVPCKYPGLAYWEIWISEAQERMVLAVPPKHLNRLGALCAEHEIEMTDLGEFTDSKRLVLHWHGEVVCDMPMDFLHGGVPQPCLRADFPHPPKANTSWPNQGNWGDLLLQILGHPSVASKESIVRQYDHEVQGGTVLKPLQGPTGRGPGDGTVLVPDLAAPEGVALGCGLAVDIALLDPWAGAACAMDEAMRNVVAAGGNPHRTALLDNFCWGDCRKPDRLGSLVLAAEACRDVAIAFGTPFVSGKDSLNNEYRVGEVEHAIPPTLLITAVAPLPIAAESVGTPLTTPGSLLVLVGHTSDEGGGSILTSLLSLGASRCPRPNLERAPAIFAALYDASRAGDMTACHDLSEGGLAVAAAEMAFGGNLGAELDLARLPGNDDLPVAAALFAETPTRFLCEVAPEHLDSFLARFRGLPCAALGQVVEDASLNLRCGDQDLLQLSLSDLAHANGADQ